METGGTADAIKFVSLAATATAPAKLLTSTNVTLVRSRNDLLIQNDGATLIQVKDQFTQNGSIEKIQFEDKIIKLLNYSFRLDGTADNETLTGINFGAGGDIIRGGDGNDVLDGLGGDDRLYGGAGNDTVDGGAGNDTLYYESGRDVMIDGGGNDTIVITDKTILAKDITLVRVPNLAADVDVYIKNVFTFTIKGQFGANRFETLSLASGTNIDLTKATYVQPKTAGTAAAEFIYGTINNDTINGLAGNDVIYASDGNDTIDGGAGNDILIGEGGNDTYKINLNAGVDTIVDLIGIDTILFGAGFSSSNMALVRTGDNLDIVFGDVKAVTVFNYFIDFGNIETLKFSNNTTYDLTAHNFIQNGTAKADTLNGHAGIDTLNGNDGNDTLNGNAGNDQLLGGTGNDTLNGGAGNDRLVGGAGVDMMTGGASADTFVFEKANMWSGIDTIADFSRADGDKLSFAGMLEGYDPLQHTIMNFIQITTVGANSVVKVDVNGGGNSFVQVATLTGVTGLTDEAALLTAGTLLLA